MNRRTFLLTPAAAAAAAAAPRQSGVESGREASRAAAPAGAPGVAVLLVDTDRVIAPIDKRIYGHFLEHINHSVEDGLFAEQIQGCGFEGEDFETYWKPFSDRGSVELADVEFQNGKKSVRLHVEGGRAGIRQGRIFVDAGPRVRRLALGQARGRLPAVDASRRQAHRATRSRRCRSRSRARTGRRSAIRFTSSVRDTQASVEIAAAGSGTLLLDFVSMMRADVRRDGMLRPDLVQALRDLAPPFIRWPGGLLRFHLQVEGRHRPATSRAATTPT